MAKKGNKNAEVWTEKAVLQKIDEVSEVLQSNQLYTLNSALRQSGLYDDWWAYITNKFAGNELVFRAIKETETIIENKIVNDTMIGDAKSAAFSIFLLKNKFGYVDKQEVDQNTHITGINLKDLVKFE